MKTTVRSPGGYERVLSMDVAEDRGYLDSIEVTSGNVDLSSIVKSCEIAPRDADEEGSC